MKHETVVIVGMGEIGEALYSIFQEKPKIFKTYCADSNTDKFKLNKELIPNKTDVMHVCFPCVDKEDFMASVLMWHKMFNPDLTIINSTTPPNTTSEIEKLKITVVHSPVRCCHNNKYGLVEDIKFWTKYIGGYITNCHIASAHFQKLGLKTQILGSSTETELAKLFSTTYYGWMIAFFQEAHRISNANNSDITKTIEMISDDNRVDGNKPLFYPDIIEGHCVIPNTEILLKDFTPTIFESIIKSNNIRKIEFEREPTLKLEIEKVKVKIKSTNKDEEVLQ